MLGDIQAQDPDALVDFAQFDDSELQVLRMQVGAELERRKRVAEMPKMIQAALTEYQQAHSKPGDEWVQPTNALNAYPSGWLVTHEGKQWRSTVSGNVHEPGVSGWREQTPEGEEPPAWVQPAGAHDAYMTGERVTYEDQVWFSVRDHNSFPPPEGWAMENPPEPEPEPDPVGPAAWEVGMTYSPPERVTYDGVEYECRQQHTAQTGWEPPNVPGLWLAV